MEELQYQNLLNEFNKVNLRLDQGEEAHEALRRDVHEVKTTVADLKEAAAEVGEIKTALIGNQYNKESAVIPRLAKVEHKATKTHNTVQQYTWIGTGVVIGLSAITNWIIALFKGH